MTDTAEATKQRIDFNNLPDDVDALKDALEEVEREIADITAQLTDYYDADDENLDDDDHAWASRAEKARRFRYSYVGKLKRKILDIEVVALKRAMIAEIESRSEKKKRAADNIIKQAEISRELQAARAERTRRNIEMANARETQEKKWIMSFLRKNHPTTYAETVSMLEAKRAEATND